MKTAAWVPLLMGLAAPACARQQLTESPRAAARPPDRPVYRLDFVLAASDVAGATRNTAFTLNLEEGEHGDVLVGRNVSLAPAGTPAAGPRQDVGLKLVASYFMRGDALLLVVSSELSALEAPSDVRKLVARGEALAEPGKATVVTSLDDDHKRYQLTVTPTKLR
ncbi:MAG TPA: hypothetical protein VLM85_31730 [Polyangiaceae bacterium]|nr:hypothetical protein [Polyangiaceae bacterium]